MKRHIILIFTCMIVLMSSCNRIDLNGEWRIVSVGSDTVETSQAVPTISFNEITNLIHGYTGVNIFNGEYEQEGKKLSISNVGLTRMAGPEEDMKLERKIIRAFMGVEQASLTDKEELLFISHEGDTLMVLAKKD